MSAERQQAIVVALTAELARQAKAGGGRLAEISGQLDLLALATAIDAACSAAIQLGVQAGCGGRHQGSRRLRIEPERRLRINGLRPIKLDASNDE